MVQEFSLEAWHEFYTVLATATAALLGLLFVAMSVRADQIGTNPVLRKRALISVQGMATILVLSLVALIPSMNGLIFGAAIFAIVLFNAIGYVTATGKVVRQVGGQSVGPWIRTIANGISAVFAMSGAISLWLNRGGGLYLLAPSLLIILALWCIAAWHLIVPPEALALAEPQKHEHREVSKARSHRAVGSRR